MYWRNNTTLPNIWKFAEGWICTQKKNYNFIPSKHSFQQGFLISSFFYLSFVSTVSFNNFWSYTKVEELCEKNIRFSHRHRWIKSEGSTTLPLARKFQRQLKIGSFFLIILPWFQLNFPRKKVGRITKSNNNNTFTPRIFFFISLMAEKRHKRIASRSVRFSSNRPRKILMAKGQYWV